MLIWSIMRGCCVTETLRLSPCARRSTTCRSNARCRRDLRRHERAVEPPARACRREAEIVRLRPELLDRVEEFGGHLILPVVFDPVSAEHLVLDRAVARHHVDSPAAACCLQ